MTTNSPTNLTGSNTSTTEKFPREKTDCRANETNKTIRTVKTRTKEKTNNITKSLVTAPIIRKLMQIEDKESSNCYEMEAVEFLDHINFDNGNFDDNAIDYIVESI